MLSICLENQNLSQPQCVDESEVVQYFERRKHLMQVVYGGCLNAKLLWTAPENTKANVCFVP